MQIREVSLSALRDVAALSGLLRAREPFVVRAAPCMTGAFAATLDVMRRARLRVWDQGNDFYAEFQEAFARVEDESCPCRSRSITDVTGSDRVDTARDFQVIVPHVLPRSDLDALFVRPTMRANLRAARALRHTQMFSTLFVSRGPARGGMHGHNFDTFTQVLAAGGRTRVYFLPPESYVDLGVRPMVLSGAGLMTLHPTREDAVMARATVLEPGPGDILYTPLGWFHRFDHEGEYTNLATSWVFDDFVDEALAAVRPVMPADHFAEVAARTRLLRFFPVLGPAEYLGRMLAHAVPPIGRALAGVERLAARVLGERPGLAAAGRAAGP